MPLGFQSLHDGGIGSNHDIVVDVVAVPDIQEDSFEAWTDSKSRANWLRDFLPKHIKFARIVTYGYETSASALFANDAPETIQRLAESFVQELRADRQLAGTLRRPIVFVCHGFGGVLVKKSLLYSKTRTAPKVVHLRDQYISTYGILFFGTPHGTVVKPIWLEFEAMSRPTLSTRQRLPFANERRRDADNCDPQMPRLVNSDFAPLVKRFYMFFFWEELPTPFSTRSHFLVDAESAAPKLDDTEAAGIHATHFDMAKFESTESSNYRTVIAALDKYCQGAPAIISQRWRQAEQERALKDTTAGELRESGGFGFNVHMKKPFKDPNLPYKHHFHLPKAPKKEYTGREDLLQTLSAAFFPNGQPSTASCQKSFVIFGMGGSGKSELCMKYATQHKERYTAVFTIRAASAETIKASFCRIGELAELQPTESAGRHFLSQQTEPWLLIIDNADDSSLDLQGLTASVDVAHILISTRNQDFRREGTLGSLELMGLKESEALQLLLREAGIPEPWDESTVTTGNMITKTLGYLPMALIQAGICIFRDVCTLADYLDVHAAAILEWQKRSSPENRPQSRPEEMIEVVYSTFDVSMSLLLKEETANRQDAADLLRIIGFFHFELIPLEIFSRAMKNGENLQEKSPAEHWTSSLENGLLRRLETPKILPNFLKGEPGMPPDDHRIDWARAELQSSSLISFDGKYISLHPLVHAWARDSLTVGQRHYWRTAALTTLMESITLPPQSSSKADGDFHRAVIPHLEALLATNGDPISKSNLEMGSFRLRLLKFFQPTLLLLLRDRIQYAAKCGWVFAERGQFSKAAEQLSSAKEMLVKLLGDDNEKTMTAKLGLAAVYWGLGKLQDAIDLQRSVVETRSRTLGHMDEQTLQAMNQLGRSYWLHGQYQEALELQQITAHRMRTALGAMHPQTLNALDNLGVTLGAWDRFTDSLNVHQQVLEARRKSLGDDHLDTIETKANLAMALLDLERLDEAKSVMTEVYDQRQRQLGREHPWTLWALCYLAKIDIEMGLLHEAEKMLDWGIAAGKRSLGDDHLGVLMGTGQLARIYARTDRLDQAETLCLETIEKVKKSRGIAHPDCVYGLWKLAQLYELKHCRTKAIQTCQQGLQQAEMRISLKHPLAEKIQKLLYDLLAASSEDDMEKLADIRATLPPGPGPPPPQGTTQKLSTRLLNSKAAEPARTVTW